VVLTAQLLNPSPKFLSLCGRDNSPGREADEVSAAQSGQASFPSHPQIRLAAESIAELVEPYKQGMSMPALARRFGIHPTTVGDHLERQGVRRRPSTRKLTEEQVAEARRLYAMS
jgi:hypothetical protein